MSIMNNTAKKRKLSNIVEVVPFPVLQSIRMNISEYINENRKIANEDLKSYQEKISSVLCDLPCTDTANSIRLATRYGHLFHYVFEQKCFYVWDGKRYTEDKTGKVMGWAKDTVDYMYMEAFLASQSGDKSHAEELSKWAKRSFEKRLLDAMIALVKSEFSISIQQNDFDTDDDLFNCKNGVLDLKTGLLLPHDPRRLITKLAPANFDPDIKRFEWDKFVGKITCGDAELAKFHQDLAGSGMVGKQLDDILSVHYGPGGNGKGIYAETMKAVFGDYASTATADLFLTRNSESLSNDRACLVGVRFLTASETDEGRRLNEALVKSMTGGDTQMVRFLHKEFFPMTPKFTPLLFTNHKPIISGTDNGIWRRVKLIPWLHNFEQDPDVEARPVVMERLREEASGILNWAYEGYIRRMETKQIVVPVKIKEEVNAYRRQSDTLGEFIEDFCITTESEATITKSDLYKRYSEYAKDEAGHNNVITAKGFSMKLMERSDIPFLDGTKRDNTGQRCWKGIRLRNEYDPPLAKKEAPIPTKTPIETPQEQKLPMVPELPNRACLKCNVREWKYDENLQVVCGNCG